MRNLALLIIISVTHFSCLKKIDSVETANTNIFDPEYLGSQWFVLEDVYVYLNSNSDPKVRFEYKIIEDVAPDLKPNKIWVEANVSGYEKEIGFAELQMSGDYEGSFEFTPDGSQEYCLSLSIYLEDEELSINTFTECRNI